MLHVCVCARMFISMRITRPLCLVSCQTFGQGQCPRDPDAVGRVGVCKEASEGWRKQEREVRGLKGHWRTVQTDAVRRLTMAPRQREKERKREPKRSFKENPGSRELLNTKKKFPHRSKGAAAVCGQGPRPSLRAPIRHPWVSCLIRAVLLVPLPKLVTVLPRRSASLTCPPLKCKEVLGCWDGGRKCRGHVKNQRRGRNWCHAIVSWVYVSMRNGYWKTIHKYCPLSARLEKQYCGDARSIAGG